jgi:small conductance mechanosensitive channel
MNFAVLAVNIDTDALIEDVVESGARILVVVILSLIILWLVQRLVTPLLRVTIREQMRGESEAEVRKRIETLSHVIYRTILVVIIAIAIVTILPEFGVQAGPLIAGLGLFGLAVGFGAQFLVRDVINGLFILAENQYSRGDIVRVAEIDGTVEDMNLRRTVLRDLDGVVHFIPHSVVTTASNYTKGYARINLTIGVAYEADIDRVFEVINRVGEALAHDPAFLGAVKEPPHALRVSDFGPSAVMVNIAGETAPNEQWSVAGELRRRLKQAFDAEGIALKT